VTAGVPSWGARVSDVIIDDPDVVIGMRDVFEQDWLLTETGQKAASADEPKRESPQPSALEASA
jgi:hypothetical protein